MNPVDVFLLFLAQAESHNPIVPESSEALWSSVGAALASALLVLAVIMAGRFLLATRRAAERAASEVTALRRELTERKV